MAVSRTARRADAAHIRRFKKLRPKARFKELTKGDQYIVTARTLSHQLKQRRGAVGVKWAELTSSRRYTIRTIAPRYVEIDSTTGFLTEASIRKIKRAVANAFKAAFGPEALFMFTIEQQDKDGLPIAPHVHAIAVEPYDLGNIANLMMRLHRIAGEDEPNTVMIQRLAIWGERDFGLGLAEADFRRVALYDSKNNRSVTYRSKELLVHVHEHFEELKKHYKVST